MQQKLKQLLKLSKEKWDAACEHAKTAVQVRTLPGFFQSVKGLKGMHAQMEWHGACERAKTVFQCWVVVGFFRATRLCA